MKKKLIYIGNNKTSGNPTTMGFLSEILGSIGFVVRTYGSNSNKLIRLFEMLLGIVRNRESNFLLIDTYSTWNFYYAYFGSQLARILSLKYICILHGGDLPKRLQKKSKLSIAIFMNANAIVAPSGYLKNAFEKEGYNVQLIPNAIEISKYPYVERALDTPKLLWVRALQEIYNPLMAIKALEEVQKKYPSATLTLIGPDKDGSLSDCQELVKDKNLESSVQFKGFLSKEQWIELSKEYTIFLNTSNFDNTPVSVVEAMALGLTVVSTNVGGMPYLIEDGKKGLLVNQGDYRTMAKQIVHLMENPELAKQMSMNARAKVEHFDASFVGEAWKKLLESC